MLPNGKHSVKIGDSIKKGIKSNLVTFKYDFLPRSLGTNKTGEVITDSGNSITVKFLNQSGTASDHTFYKGTYDKASKECVLIVDKNTGQMVLEKVDYVVNLKNTRDRSSNQSNNVVVSKKKPVAEQNLSDSSDEENLADGRKSPNKGYETKSIAKPVTSSQSQDRLFEFDSKMDPGEEDQANHAAEDLHLSDDDDLDSVSGQDNMDIAADQVMKDIQLTSSESDSSTNSSVSSSSSDEE